MFFSGAAPLNNLGSLPQQPTTYLTCYFNNLFIVTPIVSTSPSSFSFSLIKPQDALDLHSISAPVSCSAQALSLPNRLPRTPRWLKWTASRSPTSPGTRKKIRADTPMDQHIFCLSTGNCSWSATRGLRRRKAQPEETAQNGYSLMHHR